MNPHAQTLLARLRACHAEDRALDADIFAVLGGQRGQPVPPYTRSVKSRASTKAALEAM